MTRVVSKDDCTCTFDCHDTGTGHFPGCPQDDKLREMKFSIREKRVLCMMAKRLAKLEGEDVIGAILKSSGHTILDDAEVVSLALKLEIDTGTSG